MISTLINIFSKNSYFDRSVLLMLIALEALLFYTFNYREIAWYPPQYFDQTAFLTESYRLQERIHEDGLGTLWMAMTREGAPNGWLLHIEGALSGLFFGGGRLPRLAHIQARFGVAGSSLVSTIHRMGYEVPRSHLALLND